jgi:hypothetical protein
MAAPNSFLPPKWFDSRGNISQLAEHPKRMRSFNGHCLFTLVMARPGMDVGSSPRAKVAMKWLRPTCARLSLASTPYFLRASILQIRS